MRIGEVATVAGVSIQTLRYYERRGLLAMPDRSAGGVRQYDPVVVDHVRFIRRAQELGFTLEEIRDLLHMWPESVQSCCAVERRAASTLDRIDSKIRRLTQMKSALGQYVAACRNRTALQACPLLTALGTNEVPMDHVLRIELIYDQTCPNVDRARDSIANALRELGVPEVWTEWDRDAVETPENLRHFGSPTVLVDGHDVGCDEMGSPEADANSCRVYFDDNGKCLCGAPSARLIVDTIHAVVRQ